MNKSCGTCLENIILNGLGNEAHVGRGREGGMQTRAGTWGWQTAGLKQGISPVPEESFPAHTDLSVLLGWLFLSKVKFFESSGASNPNHSVVL